MLDVQLVRAGPDDLPVLQRLLQLYLHDFSGFAGADSPHGLIQDDGSFQYHSYEGGLAGFVKNADRMAYLITVATQHTDSRLTLAGFALVNKHGLTGQPVDYVVAEYHVLRKYRRAGVGKTAAHELFAAHPGVWELGIIDDNAPARKFWPEVVKSGPCRNAEYSYADNDFWTGDVWRFQV